MYICRKKLLFILLFAVYIANGIYAGGRKEDMLPAAKQLVTEKKYSEAMKILADIVKNEPERLDEVESIMAVIRSARNQYNLNYSNLLQLLKKENLTDQDITSAYNLISEMEQIDAEPDQAILESFEKARRTIVFRYNDMRFRDIMDRALKLLEEKQYWEALALYGEAAGLHRDIFTEDYPGDVIAEADSMVLSVKNTISSLSGRRESYMAAASRAAAESGRVDILPLRESEYRDFTGIVDRMALTREDTAVIAAAFETKKNELLKEGDYDVPFLSTMNRVITGRKTLEGKEGILAAIDMIWNDSIDANSILLSGRAELFFNKGKEEFASGLYRESESSFNLAADGSRIENDLIALKGYSISPSGGHEIEPFEKDKIYAYMPGYLESEKRTRAGTDYASLSQIMQRVSVIEKSYQSESIFNTMLSYREQIAADNSIISINRSAWQENESELSLLQKSSFSVDDPLRLSTEMKELFRTFGTRFDELAVSIVRAAIDIVYLPLSKELETEKNDAKKGFEMVDGAMRTMGSGDTAYTALIKYPGQAMDIFTKTLSSLTVTERGLESMISLISDTGGSASEHPLLKESHGKATNDISEAVTLRKNINKYMLTAGELLTQAEIFRNQGNRYLGEARVNLDRLNFNEAREKLQLARESYLNSLSHNEDQELRDYSDREILAISEDIIRLQTRVVIETVRKNLVLAKDYYVRERFGDAENLLINSQTMWRTVNTEDSPEVEYWLSLVQTALSVRSGRVIAETDPLYNEMTQVLNLARNDYLNAVSADEAGNRAEMLRHLASAEEKLLYVSIPFPLNQEASVLSLKILKLKDKQNFDSLFREKYEQARQKIDINPSETYTVLKDLQVINPSYPGIEQSIYRTEIKLGMRTPPPDPAKIREAETLYQRAYAIVLSNVRSNYPTALAYLNRAFELNPEEAKITTLKDRVQTEMGGTTTVVLSNYAQQQYRLAEQEFISGNYYASLAIVDKLLQDKRNRNYSPLLELKRRIDSKI